jgi:DNA-binding transcriptional ArsR family regulator
VRANVAVVEVFEAIAQPTRREIMRLLADGERTAGDVVAHFSLSQPAISQHLKVLRETGLVNERREGTRRLYSVRPEGMADLHSFIAEVLPAGLARLKRAAEAEQKRKTRARHVERN